MSCCPRVPLKFWPRFMAHNNVLITRPAGQAEALCVAAKAAGYCVYQQPLLQLEPLAELPMQQRQQLLDLDNYQHIIFVSGNAVRFGIGFIEDYWPQFPVQLNWYAVGAATAALLASHGLDVLAPQQDMRSEGLLALPPLQLVSGQRVLIVRGEGGRTRLREELVQRGAQVDDFPCYRRLPPDVSAATFARQLRDWQIGVIMLSSGEGLDNMLALLRSQETTKFSATALIVPSQRIAAQAQEAGFGCVVIADNASDVAMLSALEQWTDSSGD